MIINGLNGHSHRRKVVQLTFYQIEHETTRKKPHQQSLHFNINLKVVQQKPPTPFPNKITTIAGSGFCVTYAVPISQAVSALLFITSLTVAKVHIRLCHKLYKRRTWL